MIYLVNSVNERDLSLITSHTKNFFVVNFLENILGGGRLPSDIKFVEKLWSTRLTRDCHWELCSMWNHHLTYVEVELCLWTHVSQVSLSIEFWIVMEGHDMCISFS